MLSHEALQYGSTALMAVAIGMSVVMLIAQDRSRASLLVAVSTLLVGVAIGTLPPVLNTVNPAHPQLWARAQGVFEAGAIVTYALYLLVVLNSSTLGGRRASAVKVCVWFAITLAAWHAIASFAWPAQRLNDYELSLGESGVLHRPGFWLFAIFWMVVALPFAIGWALLSFGELDPAEAHRSQTFVVASVVVIAVTALPPRATAYALAVWISLAVFGLLGYASAQAKRGVFMSRFLSPRVAELVATRGLAEAMRPHQAEITVVSADLRGFTAYSEGVPSKAVVDLLAEYYDAVGEVVAAHGGTITNYAGDGILILVGAPIPDEHHAATGVQLARELHQAVGPVLKRWKTGLHTLGLGVGVASGDVTVGAISAETRMEYTAIGMPVNLAARLCSQARAGEVLLDAEARHRSAHENVELRGEMQIKGFSEPQQVFALA